MNHLKVGNQIAGEGFPPLVIAEIGINHGGSLKEAKKLVDAAKHAGVKVLKHQTHIVEDEMSFHAKSIKPGNSNKTIYEIMKECALSERDEAQLRDYVLEQNMVFISTPFSRAAVDRLERLEVPAYKIGSGECNNYPLVELIASIGKPIILSTGMNSLQSIQKSVDIFRKYRVPFALLHTTNLYPTPHNLVRLGAMVELGKEFPDAVLGLSDHTVDNYACFAAVALGAKILERHFTDKKDRGGPDIANSMDPEQCQNLIEGSRIIFKELGGSKVPAEEERVTMNFAFASVVSVDEIRKGEVFSTKNVWVKRPGTGELLADRYSEVIGKLASVDIPRDHQIQKTDVVW